VICVTPVLKAINRVPGECSAPAFQEVFDDGAYLTRAPIQHGQSSVFGIASIVGPVVKVRMNPAIAYAPLQVERGLTALEDRDPSAERGRGDCRRDPSETRPDDDELLVRAEAPDGEESVDQV
jgi:hypothetical protein